jgi:hypothetical protein
MNQEQQQQLAEPRLPPMAGRIEVLRKLRRYYFETIAEAADQIKIIDTKIEEMNMGNIGDGEL